MKLQICLFTLAWALVGCSSSALVTPTGQDGDFSFEALNEKIQNEEVTITFDYGPNARGNGFHIAHDSASWNSVESGSQFKVPVTKIQRLSTSPNRLLGGLIGFGCGAAAGGLAGVAIGSGYASTAETGTWADLGAAAGAGLGGLIGTFVGIGHAPSKEYHFKKTSSER